MENKWIMIKLDFFKDKFIHDSVVVCVTGKSLDLFLPYRNTIKTIGVNKIVNLFDPTFYVITDDFPYPLQYMLR